MEDHINPIRLLIVRLGFLLLAASFCLNSTAQTLHFVTEPFPPFNYLEDGAVAGPTAAIVRATCAQMQIECTFEILPWRRAILLTEQGKADGIFSIIDTPDREKIFYFSTPIIDTTYSLYAVDKSKFIYHSDQDLAGHTIGVYGPSGTSATLENMLKPIRGAKMILEIDTSNALRVLSTGGYGDDGLILSNREVADMSIQNMGIKNLHKVADAKKVQYCVAFSKKTVDQQLYKRFDETLKTLIKSGVVKAILEKNKLKPSG